MVRNEFVKSEMNVYKKWISNSNRLPCLMGKSSQKKGQKIGEILYFVLSHVTLRNIFRLLRNDIPATQQYSSLEGFD